YDQDRGWEGNGFAIAEWDWTGFAARWGPTFRQRGRMEFLSDVFVHEFAHIVSLKAYLPWSEGTTGFQVGGLVEDEEWLDRWGVKPRPHTNADLGFDMLVTAHAPFWWAEGGAEYWSHEAGYNFWGTSRDAILRMSVLEDRVLSLDEWTTRVDKYGFESERGYNHGYAFGRFLLDRYGEDWMTDMAATSAERWHLSWEQVVAETTGHTLEELYGQWRTWLEQHYRGQADEVENQGVVAGRQLSLTEPLWEQGGAEWLSLSVKDRNESMDGDTAYQEMPSYSPDGRFMAWFDQGLNIREIQAEQWGAVGGEYLDESDNKALKAFDQRTALADWAEYYRTSWSPDSSQILVTGPEDLYAPWQMTSGLSFNADGYNWTSLVIGTLQTEGKKLEVDWNLVPGTLRATEAAWSPDGQTIAFARYGDGTHEIWTIRPDGTGAQVLTDFGDGTQVQGISWTPDGSQLLVSLFRNYRQDLWMLDVQSRAWTRLTDSQEDETDPLIGADGRAWFTSDLGGIFNVYSMDLDRRDVTRHTNVLDGAYGVALAPGGHLFYTAITGHGFRIQGMHADQLEQEPVEYPGVCMGTGESCQDAQADIEYRPTPVVDGRTASRRYNPIDAAMPLTGWPVLRTTDRSIEAGSGFYLGDYTEDHYIEGEATFGKDNFLYASYWLDRFWPRIMLGYMRYTYKGTYGYGVDEDEVAGTKDDVRVVDLKFEQASDDIWLYATYWPSDYLWMGAGADASQYSFRDTGDGPNFVPYTRHAGIGVFMEWTPGGGWYSGDSWINPRDERRFYLDWQMRWTNLADPEVAGGIYDDGELLGQYRYNQVAATWTEYIPIGWFGLVDRHTLQLDFEGGWIDRNVMGWDEFIAGGRHPYHWGSGTIGNNVQFSGYEGWSLTGETMLIANGTYRFPLARNLNWRVGPTYTESLYLQLFGTVGNLWSYRVEGPSHVEGYSVVAEDPDDIRREVPFEDYAYKNSPADHPNYWLTDVGAELRVRSFIWNDWDWDSFLRVAYGMQSTAGYGDVNADIIQSSVARDAASELSDEVEPPTLRIYAGLGTGW
ncbi:MAG: hypothetical protein QGG40_02730, partial [Myxococcota bacterium]|nr:hypothetical protein [Myxococcota bacterium]